MRSRPSTGSARGGCASGVVGLSSAADAGDFCSSPLLGPGVALAGEDEGEDDPRRVNPLRLALKASFIRRRRSSMALLLVKTSAGDEGSRSRSATSDNVRSKCRPRRPGLVLSPRNPELGSRPVPSEISLIVRSRLFVFEEGYDSLLALFGEELGRAEVVEGSSSERPTPPASGLRESMSCTNEERSSSSVLALLR